MQKRLMSIILAVMLLAAMATTAGAATYEEINQDAVFVKQSGHWRRRFGICR